MESALRSGCVDYISDSAFLLVNPAMEGNVCKNRNRVRRNWKPQRPVEIFRSFLRVAIARYKAQVVIVFEPEFEALLCFVRNCD
jgi:hypothetical protein